MPPAAAPPPPAPAAPTTQAAHPLCALQRGAEDAPLQPVGDDPALRLAAELLGRRLKVTVPDGRVIAGTFACLDPQGNVVLTDARAVANNGGDHALGTLIVPAAQRRACELEVEEHERAGMEARVAEAVGDR